MGNVVGRGDYNILDFEMADISEQPALFSHLSSKEVCSRDLLLLG